VLRIVRSFALVGVAPEPVRVEVSTRRGTPGIHATGLTSRAARASAERIRASAAALGLRVPGLRITVNLAPADLPKDGAAWDLPIAVGILAEEPACDGARRRWRETALVGEIGLDGSLRPVRGALAIALRSAVEPGVRTLVLPEANLPEAAGATGVRVLGAPDLAAVLAFLATGRPLLSAPSLPWRDADPEPPDLSDVRGQQSAKRALEIAASGGHHLLLSGEPGAGKTMLARRLPGLLPTLPPSRALETTAIHGVAGRLPHGGLPVRRPPFRAPHHSVSPAALLGGGALPRPGEVSLAHNGVLFLDELPEFRPATLEALRAPLEEGVVRVARARGSVTFPARFQLVAAMNPCPCGFRTAGSDLCTCDEGHVRRYVGRVSGPLADRFDLRIEVPAVPWRDLRPSAAPRAETDAARRRVAAARDRAERRNGRILGRPRHEAPVNAALPPRALLSACRPEAGAEAALGLAAERHGLSARGVHRVLRALSP
jgi:magnesium chelatase family protein